MTESILEEAQRLTHGPRQVDYGHPLDDYTRTAAMVSALLAHKLKSQLTPHEMAMAMVCVKMSREVNRPKRDNLVDAAGYAWVAHACLEEKARRESASSAPAGAMAGGSLTEKALGQVNIQNEPQALKAAPTAKSLSGNTEQPPLIVCQWCSRTACICAQPLSR